jgi:hypothetical protein
MRTILCLGSSHTEGNEDTHKQKPFELSWPGQLDAWLQDHDTDCQVINAGEASYSTEQYPIKLQLALQQWPITDVIIEANTMHKLDVEITEQFHGHKITGTRLQDRFSIATREGRTAVIEKSRPYRTSVSTTEAVDYYTSYYKTKNSPQNVDTIKRIATEMRDGILNDDVRSSVIRKLSTITDHMPGTDRAVQLLIDYLYFRAVYESVSDANIIRYLQTLDHLTEICAGRKINCWIYFQHNTDEWSESTVFKSLFQPKWQNNWLLDQERFAYKPWLEKTFTKDQVQGWLVDPIHYDMAPYKIWIDEHVGPWLVEQWKRTL